MTKTSDYPTFFQITEFEKDKYIMLGIMNKNQLDTLLQGLQEDYKEKATGWRGQYQALARAIVKAIEVFNKK